MQGFTMGGGVGISCHGSHRIVCETSKIAMPECSIGLIPDVGGSLLLVRAPSNLGYFLGITGMQMNAADAVYAGFADIYIPKDEWSNIINNLEKLEIISILQKHSKNLVEANYTKIKNFYRLHLNLKISRRLRYFFHNQKINSLI